MSEHEHTEPEQDEREEDVEDLEVADRDQDDVAGGRGIDKGTGTGLWD